MLATPPYPSGVPQRPSSPTTTSTTKANTSAASAAAIAASTTSPHAPAAGPSSSSTSGGEGSTSLNSTTSATWTDDSTSAEVNPLFAISQRVEAGSLTSVHVVDDRSVIQGSPPPSLFHPSTWISSSSRTNSPRADHTAESNAHSRGITTEGVSNSAATNGDAHGNGNANVVAPTAIGAKAAVTGGIKTSTNSRANDHKKKDRALSSSSSLSSHSQRLVMHGEGDDDPAPNETTVDAFHDHDIESSKRDELRMKAHGWKAGVKERLSVGHHPEQRIVDPSVKSQLDRSPPRQPLTFSTNGVQDVSSPSKPNNMILDGGETPRRSESPMSMLVSASTSIPTNGGIGGPSTNSALDPGSPPILGSPVGVTSSPRSTPVAILNAPGYLVTNSRVPPVVAAGSPSLGSTSTLTASPQHRLVPMDSLTRPLTPQLGTGTPLTIVTSASSNSSSSAGPPSRVRRSNTYGSSPDPSSSRAGAGGRSPQPSSSLAPALVSRRSMTSQPIGSSYEPSPITSPDSAAPYDEVESSIAAQAEAIRKKRQEKRAEQETAVGAGARAHDESGRQGAPMIKRRSTRMSSGDAGPGAGVLVGNLIGQDHANYVLMYNMLTGIRIGVSRCQAKLKRPLTDADYTARHKFSFDIVGNELTPSVKYDFKFKDYAPWVFRELREYFYLDASDYLVSLTAKYILSELGSPGKSGSFFYFSRDYRFIIKTIRHAEHKFLRSILKEYHEYIKENPHTLLSRFYGLHRVKLPRGRKIHFVIMNNLFPPHRDIHETYDLKGSAIGRKTPDDKIKENKNAILKDLNWIERRRVLDLGPEKKALFEEQLRRDTELMQKLGIMDYSLLTGIHNVQRGNQDNLRDTMLTVFQPDTVKTPRRKPTIAKRDADAAAVRMAVQKSDPKALSETNKLPDSDMSERRMFLFYQDEGGIRATGDGNEDLGVIYYLGIIDILTPYTFVKKVEHLWKSFKHNGHMISAVPPKEYGDRFMAFVYSVIRGNDTSKRPRMYEHDPPPPPVPEKPKME